MRKTPLHQGKEQPLKKQVADAAADISRGSRDHGQQGAEGVASNTEPRTGRTLAPRHVQRDAEGGASNGAHSADAGGGGRRGVDVERSTTPSVSVSVGAVGGFREVGGWNSRGEANGAYAADVGGGGRRGVDVEWRTTPSVRSELTSTRARPPHTPMKSLVEPSVRSELTSIRAAQALRLASTGSRTLQFPMSDFKSICLSKHFLDLKVLYMRIYSCHTPLILLQS